MSIERRGKSNMSMENDLQKSDDLAFAGAKAVQDAGKTLGRFEKLSVRDIVFLAICSAAGLLFSAVMPLVAHVPVYGLIQIVVSVQTSLFLSIGLYKVRKHGALLFMSVCYAIIQLFMAPVMFFMSVISALIIEGIFLIPREGFRNDVIRFLATVLFVPVQMPFLWIYYSLINKELPESYVGNSPMFIILMVLAVIALNCIGTLLGNLIGRELKKAGVLEGGKSKKK